MNVKEPTHVPVVLLDNDLSMHTLWKIAARRAGIELVCFPSPIALEDNINKISKDSAIYLDEDLGEGLPSGTEIAKALYDRGFRNLYLSTGSPAEKFQNIPWLKGVRSKSPPWI